MNLINNTIRTYSTEWITNPWTGKAIKNMKLGNNSIQRMNTNSFPKKLLTNPWSGKYIKCSLSGITYINSNYFGKNTKPDLKHLMSISKYEKLNYKPKRPILFNSLSQISM